MTSMTRALSLAFALCAAFVLTRHAVEAGSPSSNTAATPAKAAELPDDLRKTIESKIIEPLKKRRWEWKRLSRVALPRENTTFRYAPEGLRPDPSRDRVIAFQVFEQTRRGKRTHERLVLRGRYDTKSKEITLAQGNNPKTKFEPMADVMKRLGPRERLRPKAKGSQEAPPAKTPETPAKTG